jgi:hypothetical protein
MWRQITRALLGISTLLLGGCGLYVPQMQELWETESSPLLTAGGVLEYKIKQKVYCGIVEAVVAARNQHILPRGWAVQVTLDLQVDETGSVNPGVSFITPMVNSQSFTLGFGGTLSSQGTREDKFGSYWILDKFTSITGTPCDNDGSAEGGSSLLLESDLGIVEWLRNALTVDYFTPSSEQTKNSDPAFKQESLSYHVKFVVISSGSVTPTWKLVRIATGNGSLPLAGVNRTRTHDLLMTFGPAFKAGAPNIALSSHAAQEFGIAASNGNRSIFAPLGSP